MGPQGPEKLLRPILKATRLNVNAKKTDFEYIDQGTVYPGNFDRVLSIGDYRPPLDKVWIQDYSFAYWEVDESDLSEAMRPIPTQP